MIHDFLSQLSRVCADFLCAYLILIAAGLSKLDLSKLQFKFFRPRKEGQRLDEIGKHLADIEAQMAGLSPTSDFARYFKCDRLANKLRDEQAKIVGSISANSFVSSIKVHFTLRILSAALAFFFLCAFGPTLIPQMDTKWLFPLGYFSTALPAEIFALVFGSAAKDTVIDFGHLSLVDFALVGFVALKASSRPK